MYCGKHQSQLIALADGDLSPEDTELLRTHLKECLTCYRKWSSIQKIQEILSLLPELDPPEHLSALVMARVKDRRLQQRRWSFASVQRWLPLGVGVAALLFISFTLWRTMPTYFSRQSPESSSPKSTILEGSPVAQPPANSPGIQRSYDFRSPVMVLRVKDFSSVDKELESMLRSFSRSMVRKPGPPRSVRSSSARFIDVQVPGQQFPNLIRELHKIGHLDHGQLETQKATSHNQRKAISIRIVVVGNGTESEAWLKVRGSQPERAASSR